MVNIDKLSSAYVWGFEQGQEEERNRILRIIRQQENWNDHYFSPGQTTEDCGCRDCEPVLRLINIIETK